MSYGRIGSIHHNKQTMSATKTIGAVLASTDIKELIRPEVLSWEFDREAVSAWFYDRLGEHCGGVCHRHPGYEAIIEWLSNNEGKGLMLSGDCGLGKTLITTRILPEFFKVGFMGNCSMPYEIRINGLAPIPTDARNLKEHFRLGHQRHRVQIVDDVGTDGTVKDWGNTHDYFAELMDIAEKTGRIIVATSNLSADQLKAEYKTRVYERIRATMTYVELRGESYRGRRPNA